MDMESGTTTAVASTASPKTSATTATAQISEAFTFKLGYEVKSGCVAVGLLDGVHQHLACAIPGGRVVVHNPFHAHGSGRNDSSILSFSEEIAGLCCGPVAATTNGSGGEGADKKASAPDLLFIGSQHHLQAYNVPENKSIYSIETSDGCTCMAYGKLKGADEPLVFVGGTCSIYGYNSTGSDDFWTVTGADIASLAVCPVTDPTAPELVVGTEDGDLRCYDAEAAETMQITQPAVMTHVHFVGGVRVAFSLSSGVVGVMEKGKVLWEHKSKHFVTSLDAFDVQLAGENAVVIGWSSGTVEFRDAATGKILAEKHLKAPIAGVVSCDYRMEGRMQLLAVTTEGKVTGFVAGDSAFHGKASSLGNVPVIQENFASKIRALQQKRKDLKYRLSVVKKQQEENAQKAKANRALLSAKVVLSLHAEHGSISLKVETSKDHVIQMVTITGGADLFDDDTYTIYFDEPKSTQLVPITPRRLTSHNIRVKTFIGDSISKKYFVSSETMQVDKYASFTEEDVPEPRFLNAYVLNPPSERKVLEWIRKHLRTDKYVFSPPLGFMSHLYGSLFFAAHSSKLLIGSDNGHTLNSAVNDILCDVDLIPTEPPAAVIATTQDSLHPTPPKGKKNKHKKGQNAHSSSSSSSKPLAGLSSTSSTTLNDAALLAHAPTHDAEAESDSEDVDVDAITSSQHDGHVVGSSATGHDEDSVEFLLESVRDLYSVRQKLVAEIADSSTLSKSLLLRAEDYRIMNKFEEMRQAYQQVSDVNQDILKAHAFRHSNQEKLMQQLRAVNKLIHAAAEANGGSSFIGACREAIKNNDFDTLLKLLKSP